MKFDMSLFSRPIPKASIDEKHEKLLMILSRLASGWRLDPSLVKPLPTGGRWPSVGVSISRGMPGGIRSANVLYHHRSDLTDSGVSDDIFWFKFNPARVDYSSLLDRVAFELIDAFDAYYLRLGNLEVYLDEERSRKIDRRFGIDRIPQVFYADATLCKRFFKLDPEVLEARLHPCVARVAPFRKGLFVVSSLIPLSVEEELKVDSRIMSCASSNLPPQS